MWFTGCHVQLALCRMSLCCLFFYAQKVAQCHLLRFVLQYFNHEPRCAIFSRKHPPALGHPGNRERIVKASRRDRDGESSSSSGSSGGSGGSSGGSGGGGGGGGSSLEAHTTLCLTHSSAHARGQACHHKALLMQPHSLHRKRHTATAAVDDSDRLVCVA